ncbi:PDC sensor domain-containing protein [Amycolatopsis sp. TRM77291]
MTGATRADDASRIGAVISGAIEQVFAAVSLLRIAALRALTDTDPSMTIAEQVRDLLGKPGQIAVGLGLVAAPRPRLDLPMRLLWWQIDPATDRLMQLDPDLRPASLGYYDYTTTNWFDIPRRTGLRHVVGPYVDVHGTGRYLLTLTGPVVAGGEFLGVVGADVPVSVFESHLLHLLRAPEQPFLLVNDEDRVVLSTTPRWLVGDLIRVGDELLGPGTPIVGVTWRLHVGKR